MCAKTGMSMDSDGKSPKTGADIDTDGESPKTATGFPKLEGRCLVLASGGLDSSTLLAACVKQLGANCTLALSIGYGQRHAREMESARKIADYYGVEPRFLDLSGIFKCSDSALLEKSTQCIPHSTYAEQQSESPDSPVSTYVPFRNGMFLSAAAAIALSLDYSTLAYGAHSDDFAQDAYPDCSPRFVEYFAGAISTGTAGQLKLAAPFIEWSKADIVALGLELGVPYQLTWSCYEGGKTPCGKCATCLDRARAFRQNGASDPL